MSWDHILDVRQDHLNFNDSYINNGGLKKINTISFKLLKPINIKDIFSNKEKEDHIQDLKNFFFMEHEQIDCILKVIWYCKPTHPFGIGIDKLFQVIEEFDKFYLFQTKQYIISILNILTMKEIGILSIRKEDSLGPGSNKAILDITNFGIEFMDYNLRN